MAVVADSRDRLRRNRCTAAWHTSTVFVAGEFVQLSDHGVVRCGSPVFVAALVKSVDHDLIDDCIKKPFRRSEAALIDSDLI